MRNVTSGGFSRREFVIASAFAAGAAWISPRRLLAADKGEGVVQMMRNGAAEAKLSVEPIGKSLHVILGSGGNITVLSGPDGKLFVDAGLAGSRPQINEALAKLGGRPVT